MKLTKRNGIFYADLRAEGMGRYSTGETDKKLAMQRAVQLLSKVDPAVPSVGIMRDLLNRAMDEYYAEFHQKGMRQHLSVMRRLLKDWGAKQVDEVTTPAIVEYQRRLRGAELKPSTVNRIVSYLRKVLVLAVEWGELDVVPHVPRLKEDGERHYEFTQQDIIDLERATRGTPIAALVPFLLHTGCRLGEALHISPIDRQRAISQAEWHIPVTKTGKSRTIPIDRVAQAALIRWDWAGMTVGQVHKAWGRARFRCEQMDNPGWVIHSLRHTFASRALQNGADLKAVSEYLGHSSIRMTERYARINKDNLKQVINY